MFDAVLATRPALVAGFRCAAARAGRRSWRARKARVWRRPTSASPTSCASPRDAAGRTRMPSTPRLSARAPERALHEALQAVRSRGRSGHCAARNTRARWSCSRGCAPRWMRSSTRCWSTIRTARCATTASHCWRELRALFARHRRSVAPAGLKASLRPQPPLTARIAVRLGSLVFTGFFLLWTFFYGDLLLTGLAVAAVPRPLRAGAGLGAGDPRGTALDLPPRLSASRARERLAAPAITSR